MTNKGVKKFVGIPIMLYTGAVQKSTFACIFFLLKYKLLNGVADINQVLLLWIMLNHSISKL